MPKPIGDSQGRDERFRALSPYIINSNYNSSMSGGFLFDILSYNFPDGWWTADQNYVILKATLSFQVTAPLGADVYAIIGWTFDPLALDWGGGGAGVVNTFNQSVIAAVTAAQSLGTGGGGNAVGIAGAAQEFNFQDHPIYVEKGQKIWLEASCNASTNLVWSASLYLLPTYA